MFRYNQDFADVWSPLHVGSGAILGLMGYGPLETLVLLVGYEVWEQHIESGGGKVPESAMNVLGDIAFGMAGYAAARHLEGEAVFQRAR